MLYTNKRICLFISVIILSLLNKTKAFLEPACPGLETQEIQQQAEHFELSLVFYYASWCKYSKLAKAVYDEATEYYLGQMYSATVDCWNLSCNCTRAAIASPRMKPHRWQTWPMLYVRYGEHISLRYQGEWTHAALTRFYDALFRPIDRIISKQELKLLSMKTDAIVLGLFENANQREYRKFAAAAVKWLETDPERNFRFAAAFGSTASEVLQLVKTAEMPIILLIRQQRIEEFNGTNSSSSGFDNWNASQIILWLKAELQNTFVNSHGYSTPHSIAAKLRLEQPVLALFANDLPRERNFYNIMEQFMQTNASDAPTARAEQLFCERFWHVDDGRSEAALQRLHKRMSSQKMQVSSSSYRKDCLSTYNMQYYYVFNRYLNNLFCNFKSSQDEMQYDAYAAPKLLQLYQYHKCLHQQLHFPKPELKVGITKMLQKHSDALWRDSAMPRQNRTLSVVILDAQKYKDYLAAQGISAHAQATAATALIVDARKENVFVMQQRFSFPALLSFMRSYYHNQQLIAHRAASNYQKPPSRLNSVHLPNINRQMLQNVIQLQNMTTVLLLYTSECAFSAIMSQTLLQLSGMLGADNNIRFVRLNVQTNDLPWEFYMTSTPTLLVFPRGRFKESRVFPAHLRVDIRNVFGFILAQLEPVEQVNLVLRSCKHSHLPERLQKCLQFAKTMIMQHIEQHLKFWQIFEDERALVFERLKQFKDISLDIQSSFKN